MKTSEIIKKYGKPSITGKEYLVTIKLPYPMRLSWDLDTIVTHVSCHKLIAKNLSNVFDDLLYYYGENYLKELGIDIYGGCFNYRKMRNGNSWSTHSWGIAIDLDPERNGLRTKWVDSEFSKPKYKPMLDIFYANGFINLGKEYNKDSMHFQIKD